MVYTFYVLIKAMAIYNMIYDHSQVQYLPMCGRRQSDSFSQPQTYHQRPQPPIPDNLPHTRPRHGFHWIPKKSTLSDNQNDVNDDKNELETRRRREERKDHQPIAPHTSRQEDHIDRHITDHGKTGPQLVILSYVSQSLNSHTKDVKNKGEENKDDDDDVDDDDSDDGDVTVAFSTTTAALKKRSSDLFQQSKDIQTPTAGNSNVEESSSTVPFGQREQTSSESYNKSTPILTESPAPSSTFNKLINTSPILRRRRDSISINEDRTREKIFCSCTIRFQQQHNITLHILDVGGNPPESSRLKLETNSKRSAFDISDFWKREERSNGLEWTETGPTATIVVKIMDNVIPATPYTMLMAVSGPSSLQVDCKSSWLHLGSVSDPVSIQDTSTLSYPEQKTEDVQTGKIHKSAFSSFFIGAITLCVIGLMLMIIALVLWSRSRQKSDGNQNSNKKKKTLNGQTYNMNQHHDSAEEFYEEIPEENRSHSGSRTKLGRLSLTSMRKQSSPSLGGLDRRKASTEIKTVPSTVSHFNTSPSDPRDSHLYEEHPENMSENPPPKPFLDRKALMIPRSLSSPSHSRHRRPPLKSSVSYTAGVHNAASEDVNPEDENYLHNSQQQQQPSGCSTGFQLGPYSSPDHRGSRDGRFTTNDNDDTPNDDYVDVDINPYSIPSDEIITNTPTTRPQSSACHGVKADAEHQTVAYTTDVEDEECVMIDNIVYQPSGV